MNEREYLQFKSMVKKEIEAYLPSDVQYDISMGAVEKNNRTRDVLLIQSTMDSFAPVIYMDDYFREFNSGRSLPDICREISRTVKEAEIPSIDAGGLTDYRQVKDKLRLRLVNKESNLKYLEQGPYRLETMGAAVVYVEMEDDLKTSHMGARITHELAKGYGVSEKQLFEDALLQTRLCCPYTFQSMESLIEELTGESTEEVTGKIGIPMYILSNQDKLHGAAVSLYPETFPQIRGMLGEDFYVLPSSIHELILIRKSDGYTPRDLRDMVREVNSSQVLPEEWLSNEVYEYRGREKQLIQCRIKEREWER